MESMTNYQNNVTEAGMAKIRDIVESIAPEFILEAMGDLYYNRPGPHNRLAYLWLNVGAMAICEALPGHRLQKDFPDEDKTLGELVAYLMAKNPSRNLAECVDYVVSRKTVESIVKAMEGK